MMILGACTSVKGGSEIDYKGINCAGWPEPIKVYLDTNSELLEDLYPVNLKLKECMEYRRANQRSI